MSSFCLWNYHLVYELIFMVGMLNIIPLISMDIGCYSDVLLNFGINPMFLFWLVPEFSRKKLNDAWMAWYLSDWTCFALSLLISLSSKLFLLEWMVSLFIVLVLCYDLDFLKTTVMEMEVLVWRVSDTGSWENILHFELEGLLRRGMKEKLKRIKLDAKSFCEFFITDNEF